jgi:type I restriction enzyme R subunit
MNESDTCRTHILPKLKNSGWEDDAITEQYVLTPGRIMPVGSQHTRKAGLRPDYVLFIRQNIQIAVVEAKADYANAADGLAQAMRYAEMLGVKFAYASNGKKIIEHDYITGLERDLSEFPTPDELWGRLQGTLNLPTQQDKTDALTAYFEQVGGKTPRYYQMIAINRVVNAVLGGQKRILLTMATGTGKTLAAVESRPQETHPVPGRPQCADRPGQRPDVCADGTGFAQTQGQGCQKPGNVFCALPGADRQRQWPESI